MNYSLVFTIIFIILAAWFAWRYYKLRRDVDVYASRLKQQILETEIKELGNLSSSVASILATFDLQLSTSDSERARLATVLEQMTDGVIIADAQGIVQFANPAAGKLF